MKKMVLIKCRNFIPKCLQSGKHIFRRFWISNSKLSRKKRKGFKMKYLCVHCGKIKEGNGYIYYNKTILSIFKETIYFLEGGKHYEKQKK